ncbi:hypothetical protein CSUI_010486 [Cystoisospora suis]|uniref:Transmembrane protein n=1 Tax=Cystoisospora suis TaxID=483139 RepID=A0A2C6KGU1_9APIC|nr:hypothetical protein CSUI_010486 [Cystoisospora suis]
MSEERERRRKLARKRRSRSVQGERHDVSFFVSFIHDNLSPSGVEDFVFMSLSVLRYCSAVDKRILLFFFACFLFAYIDVGAKASSLPVTW